MRATTTSGCPNTAPLPETHTHLHILDIRVGAILHEVLDALALLLGGLLKLQSGPGRQGQHSAGRGSGCVVRTRGWTAAKGWALCTGWLDEFARHSSKDLAGMRRWAAQAWEAERAEAFGSRWAGTLLGCRPAQRPARGRRTQGGLGGQCPPAAGPSAWPAGRCSMRRRCSQRGWPRVRWGFACLLGCPHRAMLRLAWVSYAGSKAAPCTRVARGLKQGCAVPLHPPLPLNGTSHRAPTILSPPRPPHSRIGEGARLGVHLEGADELAKLGKRLRAARQRRLIPAAAGTHKLLVAVVNSALCGKEGKGAGLGGWVAAPAAAVALERSWRRQLSRAHRRELRVIHMLRTTLSSQQNPHHRSPT